MSVIEFMLDTANIKEIKKYDEQLPIAGVTSNPSILKKEGKIEFFDHMNQIRAIIGKEKTLHVQVVATSYEGMLKDAEAILTAIDSSVYIKVPVNQEGVKVIKELKRKKVNVTATAIYTRFQAYLAIAAGADYIAPYYNRMENQSIDAQQAITDISKEIHRSNSETKILAASFKNVGQVTTALESGAQAVTIGTDIIEQAFSMPSIEKAVTDFIKDWELIYGSGATISSL